MKILPMSSGGEAQGASQPSRVDSVKMSTNATPSRFSPQELPISPPNRETEATVEATQPLSPQLALLAKQRRALQVKERELLAREKAMQSPQPVSGIDIARLKAEPLSVLLENGVTYDQLTEAILAGQGNSEINALKAKVESLEKGLDQKFLDKEAAAEKQVLAEMQRQATRLVQESDEYELVRGTRSIPHVMQLIERTYREEGEVLDVDEALKLVEAKLFERAQEMMKLKKIQSQFAPQAPQQPQRQSVIRTLTNQHTASPVLGAKERAMAAFWGRLPTKIGG